MIGQYGFSLKEESFILKNMGLYQLLNTLTGSNYKKGLHVFETFVPEEYNEWFSCTWKLLLEYLDENIIWIWKEENLSSRRFSTIQILGDKVNLFYYVLI